MPESDTPIKPDEKHVVPEPSTRAGFRSSGMSLWKLSVHDFCDIFSGFIICLQVMFSPWAFGTVDPWAIWTMNIMGFVLGSALLLKLLIRSSMRYHFPRWDYFTDDEDGEPRGRRFRKIRMLLALFSGLIVVYCLIHAWNAKFTVDLQTQVLNERPCIDWLPHSYDTTSSWQAFWQYLALTLSFWAIHDWLMGKSSREARTTHREGEEHRGGELLPDRMSWLLWVVCINGALLALEGIIQRVSGCNYLLFVRLPPEQVYVDAQFGPYPYRANACQYFNLIWPACVGFWWSLRRGRKQAKPGFGVIFRQAALICAGIMAVCPLIAASRLGALTAGLSIVGVAIAIWTGTRPSDTKLRAGIVSMVALVMGAGLLLGWNRLESRLSDWQIENSFNIRNTMYEMADKMATDHPVWGTGPGTFGNLYYLYRKDPNEDWFAQLHNDWLEIQITFGWVGFALIALAFVTLVSRWFAPGNIGGGRRMPVMIWISMAGVFLEARWDYPFQVYSVLFAFTIICSILFALSRYRYR